MSLVRLYVKGISSGQSRKNTYALILDNAENAQKLPIVIGAYEAQAIAIALEKKYITARPITHDLFKTFADKFEIRVKQVIIHKLVDGIFHANMICERNGIEEIIDARTSDAIALALRFDAPIFTYIDILNKAGVYLSFNGVPDDQEEDFEDDMDFEDDVNFEDHLIHHTDEELQRMLNEAVEVEDYEIAAKIRDEINRRENL